MTVDLQQIGALLEEVRLAKHISRAQLAQELGWSKKTFQRIAQGQVDMKISQFYELTSYLTVTPDEVIEVEMDGLQTLDQVETLLSDAVWAQDQPAVAALVHHLERAVTAFSAPWLRGELLAGELENAALSGDRRRAIGHAERLLQRFLKYDVLTTADFRILRHALPFLPYSELRQLVCDRAQPRVVAGWSKATDRAELDLDQFYVQLVTAALATNSGANVLEACQAAQARTVFWSDYGFKCYQRFAGALVLALRGQRARGFAVKERLFGEMTLLLGAKVFSPTRGLLERQWQAVLPIVGARLALGVDHTTEK